MIDAKNLSKTYESNSILALDNLNLQIEPGEKVAIVGRSGSGKTTLLNMLSGLARPTSGSLVVDGRDLAKLGPAEAADYRLKSVSVIFQSFQLIPQRTAAQNIELPLIIAGIAPSERKRAVAKTIQEIGLQDRADHMPFQLSGGEQQRVAIGRALVKQPSVLLADEPTGNLDSQTAIQIMDLLIRVSGQHRLTLVLVTHDIGLATAYTRRQLTMGDGKLVQRSQNSRENHRENDGDKADSK